MPKNNEIIRTSKRIEIFGFDVSEASQIRRIRAFASLGHSVHSFTMRRQNMNVDFKPDWPNTHLFMTENEKLSKRISVVAKSIIKMFSHRTRVAAADVIIARNMDMLAIAWAARALAGARQVPLIYECLDIHGALCRNDKKGQIMRAAERFLLRRVQMLVVSSPGFLREYFVPIQGYDGPTALWENKMALGIHLPERPKTRSPLQDGPIRIGWVGTIRCAPSLALLADVAKRMGTRAEICIHGIVHRHAIPEFDTVLAAHSNITYNGGYSYPDDLCRIYDTCDVVWAQDLWQRGNNSDWLLPNRIYEASWAGCPSIGLAETETGRRIVDDNLGWAIQEASGTALAALLEHLGPEQIHRQGQALLDRPEQDFVQSYRELQDVIDKFEPAFSPTEGAAAE